MIFNFLLIIICILLCSLLFSYYFKLEDNNFVNINYKVNVLLSGGCFFSLFFVFFFDNFTLDKLFVVMSFLLLGIADDRLKLKVLIRFILSSIFLLVFLLWNTDNLLSLSFLPDIYLLNILISLVMILGFMHTTNMSDGKNGLLTTYYLITFSFIFFIINDIYISNFEYFFVYSLLLFLIINLLNISYLGNSGVLTLSIISYIIFIKYYNSNLITSVDIFCLFSFLILDGLRVTLIRIINKSPIFKGDHNHIHNLFKSWITGYLIYFMFFIFNLIALYFFRSFSYLLCFSSSIFFYYLLLSSANFISSKNV